MQRKPITKEKKTHQTLKTSSMSNLRKDVKRREFSQISCKIFRFRLKNMSYHLSNFCGYKDL